MPDSLPRISIIIPVYNNAANLARCLESLPHSESGQGSEIIVIDDCSPDESTAIEEASKQNGAKYYRQSRNAGPGVARNRGAYEAQGDILVFIDSDCIAPERWLPTLVQPILEQRSSATTACYCGPVTSGWITDFQDDDYAYRMPSDQSETSFVNSCNFAIKQKVFEECGGFPEQRISEDMVLGIMLSKRGTPARYLADAGVKHDYHNSIKGYLKQRFSFAFNTVRSFLDRNRIRVKEGNSNEQSFNPVRTASGMFFAGLAVVSFFGALISMILSSGYTTAFMMFGFINFLLEATVHGRFIVYLTKRQGLLRALSYVFLLFMIDVTYVFAVMKALAKMRST